VEDAYLLKLVVVLTVAAVAGFVFALRERRQSRASALDLHDAPQRAGARRAS
jgi:putative exporter of polyketide antibiotics